MLGNVREETEKIEKKGKVKSREETNGREEMSH